MSTEPIVTKEKLETYLKELAKDFKKRGKGTPAEMILVGGASVILNYGFRGSSYDVDAIYECQSVMKESINTVGEKFGLPVGWLNDDFKKTDSFTYRIFQYSEYYKTFSGVLTVRSIRAEYLVAMKLVSGRRYKKDLSDIAGIIWEQSELGKPLPFEAIDKAVTELYDDWSRVSAYSKAVLEKILSCDNMSLLFEELSAEETDARETLTAIDQNYPDLITQGTVDEIIAAAMKKKQRNNSD